MSSDDGWVLRVNAKGRFVLQHYFASGGYPNVDDPEALQFVTLEEAIAKYQQIEDPDFAPSEYGLRVDLTQPKKADKMIVEQFVRKSFPVEAVRVTAENIEEVAQWCDGDVQTENNQPFIKVRVQNPLNDRQTKAYFGDWVLYAGKGYKVYKDAAFNKSFLKAPKADQNVFENNVEGHVGSGSGGGTANPGGIHILKG